MKISVFLHTILQQQTSDKIIRQLFVELPTNATLTSLLTQMGIQLDVENTLLVINGRTAELNQKLSDGDQVHLIPAISGG